MSATTYEWSNLSKGIRHRLNVIGVPKYFINPMADDVLLWVKCSGLEWTVKRIKSLKLYLIQSWADPSIQKPEWVRKNSQGFLYGWIGGLIKWCQSKGNLGRAQKRFSQVVQALNISTIFTSNSVTPSQLKKFLDGVNCTDSIDLSPEFYSGFLDHVRRTIGIKHISRGGNTALEYRGSPSKKAPRPHSQCSVPQDKEIFAERQWFASPENYQFGWRYNGLYGPVFHGILGPLLKQQPLTTDEFQYGGEVHFLQEPGLKLRAIASPYRIHQLALKPLGDAIYSIVRDLEWDCTFDQAKALPRTKSKLLSGSFVYSVDLSGATDYFPLGLQLAVLREIFGEVDDINLLEDIAKMRFKSHFGDIQWKRGQPLGLYPSFAMFTLTHGLVLHYLAKGDANKFYVLGDDVIIFDTDLYHAYIKFLDICKCPWSREKSISSNLLCEFAGKLITSHCVIAQYKWRKMSNDNFLDICKMLGPRSRELLNKKQRRVFDAVKHLLPPLGLNISYPGSNLFKMMLDTEDVASRISKSGVRSLVDLISVIGKNSYQTQTPYLLDEEVVQQLRDTFVEKVSLVFQKTVFLHAQCMWEMV